MGSECLMHGGKLVRARAIAAVGCKGGVCLAHSGELQGEHGRSERGTEDACRGGQMPGQGPGRI